MLGLKATMLVRGGGRTGGPVTWLLTPPPTLHTQVIDNSGALVAECVNVLRTPTTQGLARIGEQVQVGHGSRLVGRLTLATR